jgi:hypothetical protein
MAKFVKFVREIWLSRTLFLRAEKLSNFDYLPKMTMIYSIRKDGWQIVLSWHLWDITLIKYKKETL